MSFIILRLPSSVFFDILCEFEFLSGITCFQPEELPLVFFISQISQQEILFICIYVEMSAPPPPAPGLKAHFSG